MGEISGEYYEWNEENTRRIQEAPGVYGLYDENHILIYIGSSSNLRERFRHYWTTNFEGDPCKRATKSYKREFTANYEARERALLDQYRKEHGKLPKCNEKII